MSGGAPVIDGSPSSSDEIASDNELIVYGQGIGSSVDIEVSTEDVRDCAAGLQALSGRVRAAAGKARIAAYLLSRTAALTSVGLTAVERAWQAVHDGDRRAVEIDDLADRLIAAADRYDAAEAANQATIWNIPRPPLLLRLLAPEVHIATAAGLAIAEAWSHGQVTPTRAGIGMLLEETIWALTGIDDPIGPAARAIAGGVGLGLGVRSDVRVRRVPSPDASLTGRQGRHGAVATLEGVVEGIDALYPENAGFAPGTIRIDRIVAGDGTVSWLVFIPGTEGELVGSNPFNWSQNPGAMVGQMTAAAATVILAMRMAGIKPGEEVFTAGHSQGGLIAVNVVNLASQEFTFAGALTLGAPVGLLDAPGGGTEVLSIEHTEDGVPGLDNAANPTSENWTTVQRTLSESNDPEIAQINSWAGSHDTPTYADTAALVDASDNTAIQDFLTEVSGVLDEDAYATSYYYQGTRT